MEICETIEPRRGNERGRGVADLAEAIQKGRAPRISADFCVHVTEAMFALDTCGERSSSYVMQTDCIRPDPLYQ